MTSVPTKYAAGLIIYRLKSNLVEYLLLKTSYGQFHWTPPKGHVDPGEDLRTTAIREVVEESGLQNVMDFAIDEGFKRELKYLTEGNKKHPAEHKSVTYWLAKLINPNAQIKISDEHTEFGWFPLNEAKEKAPFKDFMGLLDEAEEYLTSHN